MRFKCPLFRVFPEVTLPNPPGSPSRAPSPVAAAPRWHFWPILAQKMARAICAIYLIVAMNSPGVPRRAPPASKGGAKCPKCRIFAILRYHICPQLFTRKGVAEFLLAAMSCDTFRGDAPRVAIRQGFAASRASQIKFRKLPEFLSYSCLTLRCCPSSPLGQIWRNHGRKALHPRC